MQKELMNAVFSESSARRFPEYLTDSYEWQGHIPFAFWLVASIQPRSIVELGSYKGDSYLAFCEAVSLAGIDCQCHAIDTWKGDEHVGAYGDEIYDALRQHHDSRYSQFSRLHRMRFEEALPSFEEGEIDLLHIDGLHTYEAVRKDFYDFLPKMSDRGVVILHDSAVREREFGVWKLVEELSVEYPLFEFEHSNGLAVALVGQNCAGVLRDMVHADQQETRCIREYFQVLGDRIQAHVQVDFWKRKCQQIASERDCLTSTVDLLRKKDLRTGLFSRMFRSE